MQNENNEDLLLEALSKRRRLSAYELEFQKKLQVAKTGEKEFSALFEEWCPNLALIIDFQQELNQQKFQIDALVCANQTLYHFEIKNYDFNLTYRNGQAYIGRGQKTLFNPFRQLKRNKDLLQQLIQNYSEKIELVSYVVFINKNCQVTVDETCPYMWMSRLDLLEFLKNFPLKKEIKAWRIG